MTRRRPDETDGMRAWLSSLRGRRLEEVLVERYVAPSGHASERLMFVCLRFEGRGRTRVRCVLGESIGIDDEEPDAKDMGDAGSTVVRDASADAPFRECVGRRVVAAALIRERGLDEWAGMRLEFEPSSPLVVVNVGDDLLCATDLRRDAPACDWVVEEQWREDVHGAAGGERSGETVA